MSVPVAAPLAPPLAAGRPLVLLVLVLVLVLVLPVRVEMVSQAPLRCVPSLRAVLHVAAVPRRRYPVEVRAEDLKVPRPLSRRRRAAWVRRVLHAALLERPAARHGAELPVTLHAVVHLRRVVHARGAVCVCVCGGAGGRSEEVPGGAGGGAGVTDSSMNFRTPPWWSILLKGMTVCR